MSCSTPVYVFIFIILSSLFPFSVLGQTVPTKSTVKKALPTKIAFVNINKIITLDPNILEKASYEWKELYNKLQVTIEPADKELKELEEKFEKVKKEFEDLQKSGVASNEALQRKYEEAARIELNLRKRLQERDQFVQNELNKAQLIVARKIEAAIKKLKAAQGWNMIIRGEYVIDADEYYDLTQEVLEIVNKEYLAEKAKKEKEAKEAEQKRKEVVKDV